MSHKIQLENEISGSEVIIEANKKNKNRKTNRAVDKM